MGLAWEVNAIAKPPFPWVGGKGKLIPYIMQLIPPNIKAYIEPFGGSGAVLLGMSPSSKRRDVYNDLNRNLTNFFVCLRDKTNALMRELKFLPIHSRFLFEVYKLFLAHEDIHWEVFKKNIQDEIKILDDRTCFTEEQAEELRPILHRRLKSFDVERAAMFYKCIRGSYSATVTSFGSKAMRLFNFLHLLKPAAKRLQEVVIENKSAIRLIKDEDAAGTFFYCDPPYFDAEKLYEVRMNRKFHVRLWSVLHDCKGMVLLSYNDCAFIRQLYKDFYILALTRGNPLSQKAGATYGELFITNYDPTPYLNVQLNMFERLSRSKGDLVLIHIPDRCQAA